MISSGDRPLYEDLGLTEEQRSSQHIHDALLHFVVNDCRPITDSREKRERFRRVLHAYSILAQPKLKQMYDAYGLQGLRERCNEDEMQRKLNNAINHRSDRPDRSDTSEFLESISTLRQSGPALVVLPVTLDELCRGAVKNFELHRLVGCGVCHQSGFVGPTEKKAKVTVATTSSTLKTCTVCNGAGVALQLDSQKDKDDKDMPPERKLLLCQDCRGLGMQPIADVRPCTACFGTGLVKRTRTLFATVRPGMTDRSVLELDADDTPEFAARVELRVQPHAVFQLVHPFDLRASCTLTLWQSLLGFKLPFTAIDGTVLILESAPGRVYKHGQIYEIAGHGLLNGTTQRRGNLLMEIQVIVPDQVPDADRLTSLSDLSKCCIPKTSCSGRSIVLQTLASLPSDTTS